MLISACLLLSPVFCLLPSCSCYAYAECSLAFSLYRRYTTKVLPCCHLLFTSIEPRCSSTNCRSIASPSPVPISFGELDRVVDEIDQNLAERAAIGAHHEIFVWTLHGPTPSLTLAQRP